MLSGPRLTQSVNLNSFWIWNELFLCPKPKMMISRTIPSR